MPSSAEKRISKEENHWASVGDKEEAHSVPVQEAPNEDFNLLWSYYYVNVHAAISYVHED